MVRRKVRRCQWIMFDMFCSSMMSLPMEHLWDIVRRVTVCALVRSCLIFVTMTQHSLNGKGLLLFSNATLWVKLYTLDKSQELTPELFLRKPSHDYLHCSLKKCSISERLLGSTIIRCGTLRYEKSFSHPGKITPFIYRYTIILHPICPTMGFI